jgi:hypothetical protein
LAIIRALYLRATAGLQLPANALAEPSGGKVILVFGTVIAATGYGLAGLSGGLLGEILTFLHKRLFFERSTARGVKREGRFGRSLILPENPHRKVKRFA